MTVEWGSSAAGASVDAVGWNAGQQSGLARLGLRAGADSLGEGLAGGLVPVPVWVVTGVGAFIVVAVSAYLVVRWVLRRRGLI